MSKLVRIKQSNRSKQATRNAQEYEFLFDPEPNMKSSSDSSLNSVKSSGSQNEQATDRDSYDVEIVDESYEEEIQDDESQEVDSSLGPDAMATIQQSPSQKDTAQFPGTLGSSVKSNQKEQKQRSFITGRWQLMAEKTAIRLLMKELLVQVKSIGEVFDRQQQHHQQILSLSGSNVLTNYPITDVKANHQRKVDQLREKSNVQLMNEIKFGSQTVWQQLEELMKCDRKMVQSLSKERDRNSFLEEELSRAEKHFVSSSSSATASIYHEDTDRKLYINELENQLQNARSQLLSVKLQLSDHKVENVGLRTQIESHVNQVTNLLNENCGFEEEIQRLSSQLQALTNENFQLTDIIKQHSNKSLNQNKPSCSLKKSSKAESIDVIETQLLMKLDKKEAENYQLKRVIDQIKVELNAQTEGCQKAQKVIQKFNEKSQWDDLNNKKLNLELEKFQNDCAEKSVQIKELMKQISDAQNQKDAHHQAVNQKMNDELQGLKEAMQDYQKQYEIQQTDHASQLKISKKNEKSYKDEISKLSHIIQDQERHHVKELEGKCLQIVELEDQVSELHAKANYQIEELRAELAKRTEQSESQLRFMQRRLQDMAVEQQYLNNSQSEGNQHQSLQVQMKQHLEELYKEVIQVRESIRSAKVYSKIELLEEFRSEVHEKLSLWEQKCVELCSLAHKYHGYLDIQSSNFNKIKVMLSEKDQLIQELHDQISHRQIIQVYSLTQLKTELNYAHQAIISELKRTTLLQDRLIKQKCMEQQELESQLEDQSQELMRVLNERDFLDSEYNRKRDELEKIDGDSRRLRSELIDFCGQLCLGSGEKQTLISNEELYERFEKLKSLVKLKFEYLAEIEVQLKNEQNEHERQKQRLQQSVQMLECKYKELSLESVKTLEQIKQKQQDDVFQLQNELKDARFKEEKALQTAGMRERQFKKCQIKSEESQKQYSDLNILLNSVIKEKDDAVLKAESSEKQRQLTESQFVQQSENLSLHMALNDQLKREKSEIRSQLIDVEQRFQECNRMLLIERSALDNLNCQLENNRQGSNSVEQKLADIQKDYHQMYNELVEVRNQLKVIQNERSMLQSDIGRLIEDLSQKDQQVFDLQGQIQGKNQQIEKLVKQEEVNAQRERTIELLKKTVKEREEVINVKQSQIENYIKKRTKNVQIQTVDSSSHEMNLLRADITKQFRVNEILGQDNQSLREALQRSQAEQYRLIEDKRELEEMIERLNNNINVHKQNQANMFSNRKRSFAQNESQIHDEYQLLQQIVAEKNSYIEKLEEEIMIMRREIDSHRDQTTAVFTSYNNEASRAQNAASQYQSMNGMLALSPQSNKRQNGNQKRTVNRSHYQEFSNSRQQSHDRSSHLENLPLNYNQGINRLNPSR